MDVPVSEAKAQLTDLVRRAEAGEEVVLTRHSQPAVKLVPVARKLDPVEFEALVREVQASAAKTLTPGPCAAQSQDFLYDDDGLPV
jgi:prevent-host-death family protein